MLVYQSVIGSIHCFVYKGYKARKRTGPSTLKIPIVEKKSEFQTMQSMQICRIQTWLVTPLTNHVS